ncbi:MAG: GrdX family protein [Defluviitaleaceae bacterium]|nr:GrdX family protein [Defluviitaleaceae bacterium]
MDILITNNPLCRDYFADIYNVEFSDISAYFILQKVRDFVHLGHGVLTHPRAGGLPPGTSPYKSVLLTGRQDMKNSLQSLEIVENSVKAYEKARTEFSEKHLEHFAKLDLSLLAPNAHKKH